MTLSSFSREQFVYCKVIISELIRSEQECLPSEFLRLLLVGHIAHLVRDVLKPVLDTWWVVSKESGYMV